MASRRSTCWAARRSQAKTVSSLTPFTRWMAAKLLRSASRARHSMIISWLRFIAIDIHKHYLMIGAIDAHKRVVLPPRRVELSRWPDWARANLVSSDAVVLEATTNAWAIYDLLAPLV